MSKVALSGNASGTGTFTIASPNSNTDRTLTLPDNTGTLLSSASTITQNGGSAFSASVSSYNCTTSTNVLASLSTKQFDVNGDFNNTGSTVGGIPAYAFKPSVAGYYLITFGVQYVGAAYSGYFVANLFKNGAMYMESVGTAITAYMWSYASRVVYLDGVSDYIQVYSIQLQGTTQPMAANMSGALIRKA